ncbi:MAG TPA: hypothetical protein VGL52_00090, partial [Casimicrobiaceae bacterium]
MASKGPAAAGKGGASARARSATSSQARALAQCRTQLALVDVVQHGVASGLDFQAIVDRVADVLEHIAAELDNLSHRLFRAGRIDPTQRGNHRRPAREAAELRVILRRVGASG